LCRSVKRTVSGSTSGCASASSAAMSSASSQVSAISELLQAPVGQRLGQRAVHDAPGEGLRLPAQRLDGVADGEVVLARTGPLEGRDGGADPLALAVRQQPRLARQRFARRVQYHLGLDAPLPHLSRAYDFLRVVVRLLARPLATLLAHPGGR